MIITKSNDIFNTYVNIQSAKWGDLKFHKLSTTFQGIWRANLILAPIGMRLK